MYLVTTLHVSALLHSWRAKAVGGVVRWRREPGHVDEDEPSLPVERARASQKKSQRKPRRAQNESLSCVYLCVCLYVALAHYFRISVLHCVYGQICQRTNNRDTSPLLSEAGRKNLRVEDGENINTSEKAERDSIWSENAYPGGWPNLKGEDNVLYGCVEGMGGGPKTPPSLQRNNHERI